MSMRHFVACGKLSHPSQSPIYSISAFTELCDTASEEVESAHGCVLIGSASGGTANHSNQLNSYARVRYGTSRLSRRLTCVQQGSLLPAWPCPGSPSCGMGCSLDRSSLVLLAHYFFHIELPLGWLAIPLSVSAASNVLLHCFMKPFSARPALGLLLAFDIICLTALLAFIGRRPPIPLAFCTWWK